MNSSGFTEAYGIASPSLESHLNDGENNICSQTAVCAAVQALLVWPSSIGINFDQRDPVETDLLRLETIAISLSRPTSKLSLRYSS
jgi:hypothetical protein